MADRSQIHIIDELAPEDEAMLQALYSRSSASVIEHLDKIRRSGSAKFMERYYVGYSHKSIADCGTTTIYVENVSLLAAKAIQNHPLYAGQETSTRYIDMANRDLIDPIGMVEQFPEVRDAGDAATLIDASSPPQDPVRSGESLSILEAWIGFYRSLQAPLEEHIRQQHPQHAGEDDGNYTRAVQARVFDISRGFLPAGVTTQLSWHTNLRQAADHLALLIHHPVNEIQNVARRMRECLAEMYPNSGFRTSLPALSGIATSTTAEPGSEVWRTFYARVREREAWEEMVATRFTYHEPRGVEASSRLLEKVSLTTNVWKNDLRDYSEILDTRPRGCVLPHFLTDLGQFHFRYAIDFGSFRDVQRHRNGVCRMPLLTTGWGFEPWYIEQLPLDWQVKALTFINTMKVRIDALRCSAPERQNYIALGFRVPVSLSFGLPAAVYVMEIRSGKMVHPTLRRRALEMADRFLEQLPGFVLHVDRDPNDWDVRRGSQTILEK